MKKRLKGLLAVWIAAAMLAMLMVPALAAGGAYNLEVSIIVDTNIASNPHILTNVSENDTGSITASTDLLSFIPEGKAIQSVTWKTDTVSGFVEINSTGNSPYGSSDVTADTVYYKTPYTTSDGKFYLNCDITTYTPHSIQLSKNIDADVYVGQVLFSGATLTTDSTGTLTSALPVLNCYGYTFGGWYLDASCTTAVPNTFDGSTTIYAKWTANQYTVKFDGNGKTGGTAIGDLTCTYGQSVTLPDNTFERTDYSFVGWAKTANAQSKDYDNGVTLNTNELYDDTDKSITLYAVWQQNPPDINYVTFNSNTTDTVTSMPTQAEITDNKITLPTITPQRDGYHFLGWSKAEDGKNSIVDNNTTYDTSCTLYAQWQPIYTIQFDKNTDGSGITMPGNTETDDNGKIPNILQMLAARDHYDFDGWYTDESCTGSQVDGNTVFHNNTTLYAKWEPKEYNYTIESYYMDTNGQYPTTPTSSDSSKTAVYNTTPIITPADETDTFVYDANNTDNVINIPVTGAGTTYKLYYARKQYDVTVTDGSGDGKYYVGQNVTLAVTGQKANHHAAGWISNDVDVNSNNEFIMPPKNVAVAVEWVENGKWSVHFNPNNGQASWSELVYNNTTVGEPDPAPTKKGYDFVCWKDTSTGYAFNTPVTSDITLTAQWTPINYSLTVDNTPYPFTYDDAGFSTKTIGDLNIPTPTAPDNTKTFLGWSDSSGATTVTYLDTTLLSSIEFSGQTRNIDLYPVWTDKPVVTFMVDGEMYDAQPVESGSTVTAPTAPTKNDHTFQYWSQDGTTPFDFTNSTITGNITLIAIWQENPVVPTTYNIVFDAYLPGVLGNTASMIGVTSGSTATITVNGYTIEGFDFRGWRLENNASIPANATVDFVISKALEHPNELIGANNTITLYANWQPIPEEEPAPTFNLFFFLWLIHDVDLVIDADTVDTTSVKYGHRLEVPEVPVRDGFEFTGWYVDPECTELFDFDTKFRSDVIRALDTLYAGWTEIVAEEDADAAADAAESTESTESDIAE